MFKENIPLRKKIIHSIILITIAFLYSIYYYHSHSSENNSVVETYQKNLNSWKAKVKEIKSKINKVEKDIEEKKKKLTLNFTDEEINEISNVYSNICRYIGEKYKLQCILQRIERSPKYMNIINVLIENPVKDFKQTLIIANILSYFTNKFISLKTNIKTKEIKTIDNDKILISLYKK